MNAAREPDASMPTPARVTPGEFPEAPRSSAVTARIRVSYAVTGVMMGGLWLLSGHVPIWEHLIRSAVVITIVTAVASLVRGRRAGAQQQPRLSFRQRIVFRIALIAIAAVAEAFLSPRTGDATVIVAAGLAVVAAVTGPILHRRLVIPERGRGREEAPVRHRRSTTGPARNRGRLRILLAIGVALCVAGTVAAEAVARTVIDGRITADARKEFTGPVSVGIGATPALLDAVTGRISQVTIQAPSTTICKLQDVAATATLSGVHRAQGGVAAQGISAQVTLTAQTFTALLPGYGNATVTADPASGEVQIDMGSGGLLQIQVTARLSGDTLEFSPADILLRGRPALPPLAGKIISKLAIRRQLSGLPLNLTPRSVAVTSDGVQISLTAGPTTLSSAGADSAHGCSSAA
jgi:hypothetical protein